MTVFIFLLFFNQYSFSSLSPQDILEIEEFNSNYIKPQKDNITKYQKYFETIGNFEYFVIFSHSDFYTKFFYESHPISSYIASFINKESYQTEIIIDPCSQSKQFCCEDLAICEFENLNIISKKDLEVAMMLNTFVPICENEFEGKCGTFLEIHMPGNPLILEKKQLTFYYSSGFKTMFLSSKVLCSGKYEIWLVIRMREKNYILYVKPFNVLYPSCSCEDIKSHGYECRT